MAKDRYIKLTRSVFGEDQHEHVTGTDVVVGEDLKKALQDFICKSFNLDPNEDDDDLYKSVVLDIIDDAYMDGEKLTVECENMDAAGTSGVFTAKFIEIDFEEAVRLIREKMDSAPKEWLVWLALECDLLEV